MWQGSVISINVALGARGDGEPINSVSEVRAVAGKGLEGDRYFGQDRPDREVTLIEAEAIEAMEREYQVELDYGDARRNIVTRNVALNHLVGREFRVGEVALRGIRLCEPCSHLAQLTQQKVLPGLVHRGGLRAQILNDGTIRVGDRVQEQ